MAQQACTNVLIMQLRVRAHTPQQGLNMEIYNIRHLGKGQPTLSQVLYLGIAGLIIAVE